jgi:hypothetical protein
MLRSFQPPTPGAVPLIWEVVLLVSNQAPVFNRPELGLLHLRALSDGTLSISLTHVRTLDFGLFNLCVTSSCGVGRAVCYGSSNRGLTRYGFSISDDVQTGCAVSHTVLADKTSTALQATVFDGYRGRLCCPDPQMLTVETLDYFKYSYWYMENCCIYICIHRGYNAVEVIQIEVI